MKRKHVIMIQGFVSLALTILMGIMAFLPVFKATVYPNDILIAAVSDVISIATVADSTEIKDDKELENITRRSEAYLEKLAKSVEYKRELTEDEAASLLEYNALGAEIYLKIRKLDAMYDRLGNQNNLSAAEKADLNTEIEEYEAEIIDDLKQIEYYEAPVSRVGYKCSLSPFGILTSIPKFWRLTQIIDITYRRNAETIRFAEAKSDSERENIRKKIEQLESELSEHSGYYKGTLSQSSLDVAVFIENLSYGATDAISENEAKGLYQIAFTENTFASGDYKGFMSLVSIFFVYAYMLYAIIAMIVTVIACLLSLKDKQNLYKRAIGGFRHMTLAGAFLFVALGFMTNATLAVGGAFSVTFLVLGAVVNGLAARTKSRGKTEEIYLDLTQGWGLISFIGLLVGAVTLGKAGFFETFFGRKSIFAAAKRMGRASAESVMISTWFFMILFVALFLFTYFTLLYVMLNVKHEKSKKGKKTYLIDIIKNCTVSGIAKILAVLTTLTVVTTAVLAAVFSLDLGGIAGVFAGALTALASSIAYLALSKKLCKDIDSTSKVSLNAAAIPVADDKAEDKACIPVIGFFFNGTGNYADPDAEHVDQTVDETQE